MAAMCFTNRSYRYSLLRRRVALSIEQLPQREENLHFGLALVQRELADEAFWLFDTASRNGIPAGDFSARIKAIYSSDHPVVDVNTPSQQGDTLLKLCVSSWHLAEDPQSQLDLVRFVLEKGADPNAKDSLGETALDWLFDCCLPEELPLSFHRESMVQLLVTFGGR